MIMPEYNTMCLYKAGMPFLKRPAITSLEETMTCCTMSIVSFMHVLALLLTYAPLPSLSWLIMVSPVSLPVMCVYAW